MARRGKRGVARWMSSSWAGVPLRALRRAWERERVPAERGEAESSSGSPAHRGGARALRERLGAFWGCFRGPFACCLSSLHEGSQAASGAFKQGLKVAWGKSGDVGGARHPEAEERWVLICFPYKNLPHVS